MSEKIVAPKGMRKAVSSVPVFAGISYEQTVQIIDGVLSAALCWQKENPPVPTEVQMNCIREKFLYCPGDHRLLCAEWVCRMYDAPEPEEAPKEIEDLLLPDIESGFFKPEILNERITDAYRRGQKSTREIYRFGFTGFKRLDHPILTEWLADAKDKGVDQATQANYCRLFERAFEAGKKEGPK